MCGRPEDKYYEWRSNMKTKIIPIVQVTFCLLLILYACMTTNTQVSASTRKPDSNHTFQIVTNFYSMYAITSEIVGNHP